MARTPVSTSTWRTLAFLQRFFSSSIWVMKLGHPPHQAQSVFPRSFHKIVLFFWGSSPTYGLLTCIWPLTKCTFLHLCTLHHPPSPGPSKVYWFFGCVCFVFVKGKVCVLFLLKARSVFCFVFVKSKVWLCSPDWLWTHHPPVLASQVLPL
jgi:hypothetical protein